MPAPINNQNAVKSENEKLSGDNGRMLKVRCLETTLRTWKKKAHKSRNVDGSRMSLSDFVHKTLDAAPVIDERQKEKI